MLLAKTDPAVLVAVIAGLAGIVSTAIASGRTSATVKEVNKNLGSNGKPLHEHVADLAADVVKVKESLASGEERFGRVETKMGRIDDRFEHEASLREGGQQRQERMAETLASVQSMLSTVRIHMAENVVWQQSHTDDDIQSFNLLRDAVDGLSRLLGDPQPGMNQTPLIQYVHDYVHRRGNEEQQGELATSALIRTALKTLDEATALLNEVRTERRAQQQGETDAG